MNISIFGSTSSEKLKCSLCSSFLSHFPIRLCPNNVNICGRCVAPEGEIVHNAPFEALSQFVRFPCRYNPQGCEKEFQPKDIPNHEKDCIFRIIPCPCGKFTTCLWKGPRPEYLDHCRSAHSEFFLQEVRLDLSENAESYALIERDEMILILKTDFDVSRKVLFFELFTSEFQVNPKTYSCQLIVKSENKNLTMDFVSSTFEEVAGNELKLLSLNGNNAAMICVKIVEVFTHPDEVVDLEMLGILKCFICEGYSIPPIHHCVKNSETLCQDCKAKHAKFCNDCKTSTASTRNINLDKIAQLLNYPCKYTPSGCSFVCKPEKIKNHQISCSFATSECPLSDFEDCNWNGQYKYIEEHIQNNHQELVSNSSQISKRLTPERMRCDIIKFAGELFRLICKTSKDCEQYFWSVELLGAFRDDFKFEIELIDPLMKGKRLLVRQKCSGLKKTSEIFKTGDFCYFYKDQMRDFVADDVITFKVHVFV